MRRETPFSRLALILSVLLPFLGGNEIRGQCSDAGACTISRHADGDQNVRSHSVGLRYLFGKSGSPESVTYHSVAAEAGLQVFLNSRLTITLPLNRQSGPLGSADGLGDVIALWDQRVAEWSGGENRLQLHGGLRLATGKANANSLLSMAYQPGLGANDVILGTSLHLSKWSGGVAYQIAGGRNDHPLIRLKRGDQLVAWSNYAFAWEKTELAPGIMIVKQLNTSSILDLSSSVEKFISVPNSDQIQVNLALRIRQELSPSIGAELFAAFPLREREVNVDGLKRSLALSIGVLFNF